MPIKIPKGFPRRKSSGNVLEEPEAAEPSFKVFARPQTGHKSLDVNMAQRRPQTERRNSYEQEDDDLFTVMRPDAANRYVPHARINGNGPDSNSGSGGTTNSLSTAQYDSAASSTRLSSASTNPSSIDTRSDKNFHTLAQLPQSEPAPPPPTHQHKTSLFSRNAGRTFSFGVKTKPPPPDPTEIPVPPVPAPKGRFSFSQSRERATTVSTVTSATPPRLLESDLSLDNSGAGGFENMFDGIGPRSREPSPIRRIPTESPVAYTGNQLRPEAALASRSAPPVPITVDRTAQIESSPYSWTSENSRDGLMHTPSSTNTIVHHSPRLTSGRAFGKPMSTTATAYPVESNTEDNMFADTPSRPRTYSRPTRQTGPPPTSFHSSTRYTGSVRSNATIHEPPTQPSPIPEREDAVFDPALLASAELATKYQETKHIPPPPVSSNKKVMTPAEFERYKQQQDERHRLNKVFQNKHPESDESDDNYDDAEEDDEAERDKQAAKQRRKQEAHLAVYRQTMMKVTGEGPTVTKMSKPSISISHEPSASQSATDLANQFSAINFDKSPTKSSEDEDDDVPLGILAAHGFPNRNKPPNRLAASTSNPNLRGVIPPQPAPASVAGESTKRGSLPVFARHLPEDPYYGSSLVNQPNRESLGMSSNIVPSGASTAHPHHPAGLVGVIAGEERARAMRRGSPSGNFELPPSMPTHPSMGRSQTTGSMPNLLVPGMPSMPGMPGMPMMPGMLSPGDQAQIQMSQQMTQMMQMQMQWMQQMQQLMVNQGQNPGMVPMNQMPQMPQMPQMSQMPLGYQVGANGPRPQSVPLQNHTTSESRTMSLLNPPSMAGWNNGGSSFLAPAQSTYAPSIAPSERSNIGLASRYRPVTTNPEPEQTWNKRASTMTSNTFRPLSVFGGGSKQPASTVRKVSPAVDDEDDEQGWAEMKAKKDQKKKTWKLRKGQSVLQELYN